MIICVKLRVYGWAELILTCMISPVHVMWNYVKIRVYLDQLSVIDMKFYITCWISKLYGGLFVRVGFCPGGLLSGGLLSGWSFVRVGFCPGGLLSGIRSNTHITGIYRKYKLKPSYICCVRSLYVRLQQAYIMKCPSERAWSFNTIALYAYNL